MSTRPVPEGYHTLTPYLTVLDVPAQIAFLETAFGGRLTQHIEGPDGRPRHAEMQVGDSKVMIGQSQPEWPTRPGTLYVYLEDVDAAHARALAAGAESVQEPTDMFYGDRSGGVRDTNGNQWWVATRIEDVDHDEMQRRAREMG